MATTATQFDGGTTKQQASFAKQQPSGLVAKGYVGRRRRRTACLSIYLVLYNTGFSGYQAKLDYIIMIIEPM